MDLNHKLMKRGWVMAVDFERIDDAVIVVSIFSATILLLLSTYLEVISVVFLVLC
ncbi:hypothetical protein MKX03_018987 [Papaver bracteatum]|nr:hypothetical protein MKX03_018987 [Papaver bracteatum]